MSLECPQCGEELTRSVGEALELFCCVGCGWRKRDMLASACCEATYHVAGRTTHYYVCDVCLKACDPKLFVDVTAPREADFESKRT